MVTVVGVRFKRAGKVYYFDPDEHQVEKGQAAIVETARGIEYGDVVIGPKQVPDDEIVPPLKKSYSCCNRRRYISAFRQ